MTLPENIFQQFTGAWIMQRTLFAYPSKVLMGKAGGSAVFMALEKNVLNYKETGKFFPAEGGEYSISREYCYHYHEKTKKIDVYFSDNGKEAGLFHTLHFDETGLTASAVHLCRKDTYHTRYAFCIDKDNLKSFKIYHHVEGPEKSYDSET